MMPPLNAIPIQVNPHLAGCKVALKQGGTIYISPAMMTLVKTSTPRELQKLLQSIKLLDLDGKHDAQWWADTCQIFAAQLAGLGG